MTSPLDDRQVDESEVLRLFERIPEDPTARDELTARFQPLAEYLARRFGGRGQPIEDLVQVAYVGLIAARSIASMSTRACASPRMRPPRSWGS